MIRFGALGLCVLLLATACSLEAPTPVGAPAPDFELELLEGGRVRLAEMHGRTVLLDFWATWCPPCVLEIPELNAFYREHLDRGVEVLAISIDAVDRDELASWAREKGIQYPVALGDMSVAGLYGAEQFPLHVLISPEGRIVERLTPGYHDRAELAALVARQERR